MILLIPLNGAIAAKTRSYQIRQMKEKDQRVKMMNEILSGIKVTQVKLRTPFPQILFYFHCFPSDLEIIRVGAKLRETCDKHPCQRDPHLKTDGLPPSRKLFHLVVFPLRRLARHLRHICTE